MSKLNKIMALIVIIFTTFVIVQSETKAACPDGFTSITKVVTVGNCDYDVFLCVRCPYGPVPGEIHFTGYTLSNPNCINSLNMNQVFDGIKAAISVYPFIQDLCEQLQAPPCNEAQEMTFWWYNCWNKELVDYFGEDHIVYNACEYNTYCKQVIKYCWNGNSFNETIVSTNQIGTPTCPVEVPPDPTQYNQPTTCFRIDTPCD
ncbi:MAG: hypothetical protein A2X64_03865 [Ignavibacteria bacterium GWF2_33_9]|nr:MAG: hypothetical protein A2X64_03865 [Ignavibacteria bacterium GWF2_33_9]